MKSRYEIDEMVNAAKTADLLLGRDTTPHVVFVDDATYDALQDYMAANERVTAFSADDLASRNTLLFWHGALIRREKWRP